MWRTRLDVILAVLLAIAIAVVLLLPARESAEQNAVATNLFAIVEADFRNPILSSPTMISVLNGATKGVAQFAGYDELFTRVEMGQTIEVLNVTRFAGDLLGMLNPRWVLKETNPSAGWTVFISESLWRRSFESDPEILGRELRLHQIVYRIGGVVSARGDLLEKTDLWIPVRSRSPLSQMSSMRIVGRMILSADFAGAQRFIAKTFSNFLADEDSNDVPRPHLMPVGELLSIREITPTASRSVVGSAASSDT